jgi:tRNA-dihydrouridine synthase C
VVPRHQAGRLKQWLNYLRRRFPEAEAAYLELRVVNDPRRIDAWLQARAQPLAFAQTQQAAHVG